MINSFCQSGKLWNEEEDWGLGGTGKSCSHAEEGEREKNNKPIINRDVQGETQVETEKLKEAARVRKNSETGRKRSRDKESRTEKNELHSRRHVKSDRHKDGQKET